MASYTYSAVGNREDLIDIITNIAPHETPLTSSMAKTTANAMTHAWLTDSLDAPEANKHLEDADFSTTAASARVRLDNYIQIFMEGVFVTDSQEAVQKAGIKSELAYQLQKKMKKVAKDLELAVLSSATKTAGDADTPGQMAGIAYFNDKNVVEAGADGKLTEEMLNDAIQKAWEAGGSPELVVVSGKNKRTISGFTASATKNRDMTDKKLVNVVDVYESDFGLVKMQAHRMQTNDRIDIIESQYFKLAWLVPFKIEDLARKGLKKEKVIHGQVTMECRDGGNAHAAITGIGVVAGG